MAIIKCKECGKEISDKAKKCPNCGYDFEKIKNAKDSKKKKIIIALCILLVVFSIPIISIIIIEIKEKKYELSDGNAYEIYKILEKHQSDFKDPSSVIVEKASTCNEIWDVEIKAKNSYGNYTSAKYLIVSDLFLDMDKFDEYCDTNEKRIKAINFLLEQKQCIEDGKSIYINEKDINAINERLKRNYK